MEATTSSFAQEERELAADTLRGDVRDALLTHIRDLEKPFSLLSETRQRDIIEAIDRTAQHVVRGSVDIIANQGFPAIDVRVSSKGKWGDGSIELTVGAAFSQSNANKISEHGAGAAVLVLAEPGEFFGERRAARPDPDQRRMDLGADEDEAQTESAPRGRNRRHIRETEAA
ncbi:hypothetical protein PUR23_01040 [Methylorubrum populi]|uniref:hypothetical protein n=1 Tax=Methylorubrum populi TaxID=223967 RepID=UPI0031F80D11